MRRSPYGACSAGGGMVVASTDKSSEEGCIGRRVILTIIVASFALMLAVAGGPAAAAATRRLPIKAGPHGASRAPGRHAQDRRRHGRPQRQVQVPGGAPRPVLRGQRLPAPVLRRQPDHPFEVLTAAHCVDFVGVPGGIPLSDLRVVVGRTVLTSTQGQKRRAAAIDIHPSWDPVNFSFDAAVVHLASPINGIRPIMLVTPGVDALERPGTLATVTGWGNTIQQPAGPGGGGS